MFRILLIPAVLSVIGCLSPSYPLTKLQSYKKNKERIIKSIAQRFFLRDDHTSDRFIQIYEISENTFLRCIGSIRDYPKNYGISSDTAQKSRWKKKKLWISLKLKKITTQNKLVLYVKNTANIRLSKEHNTY
jgi:hypothetical protein